MDKWCVAKLRPHAGPGADLAARFGILNLSTMQVKQYRKLVWLAI